MTTTEDEQTSNPAPTALADLPHTTREQDAMLDALEELPPASEDWGRGAHEFSRAAARRIQAVRLRMQGATYERIAQVCGYSDKSTAGHVVRNALNRLEVENVAHLRALENMRLDADELVLRGIIAKADATDLTKIRAIDSRRHLSARRARLNGLDAPLQVQLSAGAEAAMHDALSELEQMVLGEVLARQDELPGEEPLPQLEAADETDGWQA